MLRMLLAASSCGAAFAAPFTLGNLAVVRIAGTNGATTTAPVFIDELATPATPTGALTLVQSIALPTAVNAAGLRLTLPAANSHGLASLANDGSQIAIVGMNLATGATPTAGVCQAVVGTIDAYGNVDVSTSLGTGASPFPAGVAYGAATDNGTNFWVCGLSSGGVFHTRRGLRVTPAAALLDANAAGWSGVVAQNNRLFAMYSGNSAAIRYIVANATTGGDMPVGGPLTWQPPAGGVINIGAAGAVPVGISGSQFRQFTFVGDSVLLATEATTSAAGGLRIFRRLNPAFASVYNASVFVQDVVNASGPAYSYNIPVVADRSAIGVAQATIGGVSIAYVSTANGRVYAFNIATRAWVSNTPVYTSAQNGTLRAIMQVPFTGTASPTASPTATPSSTATLSTGATASATASPSFTSTGTQTPSRTSTPSSSVTPSNSPTPTPSAVNVMPGADLVVLRVATGVASTLAAPALLDVLQRGASSDGQLSLLGTVSMPMLPQTDPDQFRLTVAGSDTRWGGLSRSDDGRFIVLAGVDAAPGTAWAAVRRTVGTLSHTGAVDVSTAVNASVLYANGIFSAGSVDGSGFWASGAGTATTNRGVAFLAAGGRTGATVWAAGSTDTWIHNIVSAGKLMALYASTTAVNLFTGMVSATTGADLPRTGGAGGVFFTLPAVTGHRYRGFAIIPGQLIAVAEEFQGGVYIYAFNGTAFVISESIYPLPALAADRTPVGLAIMSGALYVSTASGKIFGLDLATRAWLNGGYPLYACQPGFGLRGIAVAPVAPSATPSASITASTTPSASATATQSSDPAISPTPSPSQTPSRTGSASESPAPSITASSSITPAGTPMPTVTPVNVLPGADLVVMRVANGVPATLATPVLLDVLATGATSTSPLSLLGTVPMPMLTPANPDQMRLTVAGSDTRWGGLTRSVDGRFLVVAGVDAAPGTAVSGARRSIGTLSFTGEASVTTSFNSSVFGLGIFSACSVDGSSFWATGAAATLPLRGTWWANSTSTSVVWAAGTFDSWMHTHIAGGKLFSLYASPSLVNFWSIVTTTTLTDLPRTNGVGANAFVLPLVQGHRYRAVYQEAGSMLLAVEESQGAMYVFRWNATAATPGWVLDPSTYQLPTAFVERTPVGVTLLRGIAYVSTSGSPTAPGRIFGFDTAVRAWLNNGAPLYTAPAGSSLRGIALAPVAPSFTPTGTPSSSATASSTATVSGGASASQTATPPSTGTTTATSTRTATSSVTSSPSSTASVSLSATITPTQSQSPVNVLPGGEFAVLRVANGVAANVATPALVDIMTTGATHASPLSLLGTITLPLNPTEPGQMRLTVGGTDTRWGSLSRSADGRFLCFAGVDAAPGAAWATVRRTIGTLSHTGALDVSTAFNGSMYSNGIWSAASVDGAGFWTVGAAPLATTRGIWYVPAGATTAPESTVIWTAGGFDSWISVTVQDGRLLGLFAASNGVNQFWSIRTVAGAELPTTASNGGLSTGMPASTLFRYRGSSTITNVIFVVAEEAQGGLVVLRYNSTTALWVSDGAVYAIPALADRSPVGVLLRPVPGSSPTVYTAFVTTMSGKIFAFDTSARAWLNNGEAIYTAPAGSSLRGIALAPVAPSATPSASWSSTPTASATASLSASPDPEVSPTATSSLTASGSVTATASPTSSLTGSTSVSSSATPMPTVTPVNVLPGADLVVMRVANGVPATLATPVLLDALQRGGTADAQLSLLGTVTMPVLAPSDPDQMRLTVAGSDTRWGGLTRSVDGRVLVIAGVDAAPGTAVSSARRSIGTLSFTGEASVTTSFNSSVFGLGIFSACSVDGSSFWATGAAAVINMRGTWWVNASNIGVRSTNVVWAAGTIDSWMHTHIAGGKLFSLYASPSLVNFWSIVTTTTLTDLPRTNGVGANAFVLPLVPGHRYRAVYQEPASLLVAAEETLGGVFVFRWNASAAWSLDPSGVYVIPVLADRSPVGAVISRGVVYMSTASGKIYGLDTATQPATWVNGGAALYTAPAGSSLRGIALAPAGPSATPTVTSTRSGTRTATPSAAETATSSVTSSATATRSNTGSVSRTSSTTRSGTGTPSVTGTQTGTPSATGTQTGTPTSSQTASNSGTAASTGTATGTTSRTGTASGSQTRSQTGTPSASATGSVSATTSETASVSATATGTPSSSGTETGTASSSQTGSGTRSPSSSATGTGTPSGSQTGTPTGTAASTATGTPAASGTATKTRVPLPSSSPTRTRTRTATRTKTKTKTKTRTPSKKKKLMA